MKCFRFLGRLYKSPKVRAIFHTVLFLKFPQPYILAWYYGKYGPLSLLLCIDGDWEISQAKRVGRLVLKRKGNRIFYFLDPNFGD